MKKARWNEVVLEGLLAQVERVPDPRTKRSPRHLLTDILVISICGVLSGCEGCVEIAEYGRRKEEFFRTILELPHGIPSHDTFNRVLALLKPQALQECLIGWLRSVRDKAGERQIAIDGKSLRRTFDRAASQNMLHLVSAWSTANGITLGQVAVDEKSNEITAIPQLLQAIDLTNATVTIDAMGCQKNIAKEIIDTLSRDSLAIDSASDGQEALARIRRNSYDLVVCNLKISKVDGRTLYRAITATTPALARRVIFVTTGVAGTDTARFLDETGCPWVSIPFRPDDLLRAVTAALA